MSNSNVIAQFLISVLDMNAAQATVVSLMCNYRENGGITDLKTARKLIDHILEVDYQEHTGRPISKESPVTPVFREWAEEIYTEIAANLGVDLKDIDSVRFEEPKPDWVDPVMSEPTLPPGEFQEITTNYIRLSPDSPEAMLLAKWLNIPSEEIAVFLNAAAYRSRNS